MIYCFFKNKLSILFAEELRNIKIKESSWGTLLCSNIDNTNAVSIADLHVIYAVIASKVTHASSIVVSVSQKIKIKTEQITK